MARKKFGLKFSPSLSVPQGTVRLTDWDTGKALYIDRSLIVLAKPLKAGHYEPGRDCDCDECQAAGAIECGERTLVVSHCGEVVVLQTPDEVMGLLVAEEAKEEIVVGK